MRWKHCIIIGALAAAAYWPSLRLGFFWDDHFLITGNSFVKSWSWEHIAHDFSSGIFNDPQGTDFFRPLLTIANRVNFSLSGENPFGYHLLNLFMHALNAVLTAVLVHAVGFPLLTAFIVGTLWAVHPGIVQNLIMVVGRDELMSYGLSMGALICLLRPGAIMGAWGLILFMLALLAKESAIMLPFLFCLLKWYRSDVRGAVRRLVFMAAIAAVYLGWHHHVMNHILPNIPWKITAMFTAQAFPRVIVHYLGLAIWPVDLFSDRLLPPSDPWWPIYLGVVLLWLGWVSWRRNRTAILGTVWFGVMLAPKMAVTLTGAYLHDHWLYPLLWVLLIPASLILTRGWNAQSPWVGGLAKMGWGAVLVWWMVLVHFNLQVRGTEEKFYRWSIRPHSSPVMRGNLAALLMKQGRVQDALVTLHSSSRQ